MFLRNEATLEHLILASPLPGPQPGSPSEMYQVQALHLQIHLLGLHQPLSLAGKQNLHI